MQNIVNVKCLTPSKENGLVTSRTNYVEFPEVNSPTKENWKSFGSWYQEQRESADKTQEEVAKLIGKHVKTVSRIETGDSGSKRDTVIALANAIGISVSEALERAGFASTGVTDEDLERTELMAMYSKRRKLTPAKKEAFKRILDMVDRELDKLYEESLAETQSTKPQKNGN